MTMTTIPIVSVCGWVRVLYDIIVTLLLRVWVTLNVTIAGHGREDTLIVAAVAVGVVVVFFSVVV